VFRRYDIISPEDLRDAARKLDAAANRNARSPPNNQVLERSDNWLENQPRRSRHWLAVTASYAAFALLNVATMI
jgi:hypothetical protein